MILSDNSKKLVYTGTALMIASMLLPWESLSDYTYSESMGLMLNITSAIIFLVAAAIVIVKPISTIFNGFGTNVSFSVLALLNALTLYFGMQYFPETYTIGYLLFPTSVIVFMLGVIFSVKKIDGTQGN
jgi:hypothetical protein